MTSFDSKLEVEDNDVAERTLPNGIVERFRILDTGFHPGLHGAIPPNYQMKVEKLGAGVPLHSQARSSITHNYNVAGPNSRINLNSIDVSGNVANIGETGLFDKIRESIIAEVAATAQRDQMLDAVNEIESTAGTSGMAEGFRKLMAVSADAMTILMPFLPALTKLVSDALS